ncbi:MAG: hypothetical protein H0X65_10220 [Gemmatimonadetes bacterium]|nr:hypothetical protein [Gemmatimonadota bacterium]
MKRTALLPLLFAAACAAPAGRMPAADSPAGGAAVMPATQSGQFVLLQNAAPIATERFTRSADRLEAELVIPTQIRVSYTADLTADATVRRIELQASPPDAPVGGAAAQRSSATFQGDSVFLEQTEGEAVETARRQVRPGTIPYINPSPSLMEQIVRRARQIGGERVEVPVFLGGEGAQTGAVSVTFMGADSARLVLGDVQVHLHIDASGTLLGGRVPAQNVTIERGAAQP